jgi:hypothetical protein
MGRMKAEPKKQTGRKVAAARAKSAGSGHREAGAAIQGEIDGIIRRLDAEIPQAQRSMNDLLTRLRSPRR